MYIKDKLQIYIITYNRKSKLQNTLNSILKENSPIREFDITILDNASTDGSSEMIEEYCVKHKNIKHVRHHINIGGNANICRAFELSAACGKEYAWILCDDDYYDWENWAEIENAICYGKYDMLYTCTQSISHKKDIAELTHQATFIPAIIYSVSCINDEVLQNMYNTINTMFCQTMLHADIICNKPDRVFLPIKDVVIRVDSPEESDKTIIRGRNERLVHPDTKNVFWHIGFIKAIQIVSDKKKRNYIIQKVRFNGDKTPDLVDYFLEIIRYNKKNKQGNLKNLFELYFNIGTVQKLLLCLAVILYNTIYFYKGKNQINISLLGFIRFTVFSTNWFKR